MDVTFSFHDLVVVIVGATKVVAVILLYNVCPHRFRCNLTILNLQYFLFEALYGVFMSFFPDGLRKLKTCGKYHKCFVNYDYLHLKII